MKIGLMFDRFGPYHVARIAGAMKQTEILAVEAAPHRAIYDWVHPDLPEDLAHVVLTERLGEEIDPGLIQLRLDQRVLPSRPDAIAICGWATTIDLATLRWARERGIPTICMSDTNEFDFERKWFAEQVKSGIAQHYAAGLSSNDSQIGYLAKLGIARSAIFRGFDAVDNGFFRREAARWRLEPGLPSEIADAVPAAARGRYFLASNRFIEKKNLLRLLDAYAEFRQGREDNPADWPLVLLGDGELRPRIEARIEQLGLSRFVHLPGFFQVDALPRYYATAGGFVHASTTEQWGLVINEAMASGLPTAASDRCGATQILIEDGVTGFSFDPFSKKEITLALKALAELPEHTPLIRAAEAKVDEFSPEKFGEGLFLAAKAALANPTKPGFLARRALDLAIARATYKDCT